MNSFDPLGLRVGIGTDLHRVQSGSGIWLAGICIPCEYELIGHSDADLILHALTDAFLGAAGMGDIGSWFPDDNPDFAGADSSKLLECVLKRIYADGYTIINADVIITCEKPKIAPYKDLMRQKLSELIGIPVQRINVKAKTNEGCDAVGKMEAMSSLATVLIYREKS